MRPTLFAAALLLASALPLSGTTAAEILTGSGTALVRQFDSDSHGASAEAEVPISAGLGQGLQAGYHGTVFRFQLIRPDKKAVGFLVWTVPVVEPFFGTFSDGQDGVGLVYYEQTPGNMSQKLFLSDSWTGAISLDQVAIGSDRRVVAHFDCTIVDYGPDGKADTADDGTRDILDAAALFTTRNAPTSMQYYESGGTVCVYEEPILFYDDGCTTDSREPDYGGGYYDSASADDEYDDASCSGDTYDDGGGSDYDYDDYETSDEDEDDYSNDCDFSDDDSGDDYDDGSDDSDDYGDDYEYQARIRTMSWAGAFAARGGAGRSPLRVLLPLATIVVVLVSLRMGSGRRENRARRITPIA